MDMLWTVGKGLLFLLSSLGWWQLVRSRTRLHEAFVPAFVIAVQITLLTLAGILNILRPMALALYFGGLVALAAAFVRGGFAWLKAYASPVWVLLLVLVALLAVALRGQLYAQYDDFSHWGLVYKNALVTHRFPTFQDAFVDFVQYPPGATAWLYYFGSMVCPTEAASMLAQSIMSVCFCLPVMAYVKRRAVLLCLPAALFMHYLLCVNVPVNMLRVDTLLPLCGMAGLALLFDSLYGQKNVDCRYAIPLLCAVAQIKNSGLFFLAVAAVMLIVHMRAVRTRQALLHALCTLAVPLLLVWLWNAHCSLVFVDPGNSKHALSLTKYIAVLGAKSLSDMGSIALGVARNAFAGSLFWACAGFGALCAVLLRFAHRSALRPFARLMLACAAVYVVYTLGVFVMYLVSMPGAEATGLHSFDRYRATILIAVLYAQVMFMLWALDRMEGARSFGLSLGVLTLAAVLMWMGIGFANIFALKQDTDRHLLYRSCVQQHGITRNDRCIVYLPHEDSDYSYYVMRYLLLSNDVEAVRVGLRDSFAGAAGYDRVIIAPNKRIVIRNWLATDEAAALGDRLIVLE